MGKLQLKLLILVSNRIVFYFQTASRHNAQASWSKSSGYWSMGGNIEGNNDALGPYKCKFYMIVLYIIKLFKPDLQRYFQLC